MSKLDFAEIKRSVSFEKAMTLLGLQLKPTKPGQWRGACPCKKGDQRALCVTEEKGFYCWGAHIGGSVLDLAMHVRQCTDRQAAEFLIGTVSTVNTVPGTVPQSERGKFSAVHYLKKLEPDHPAVHSIGFSDEIVQKVGIGYATEGTLKGHVAILLRDENGEPLGFIGVTDAKLPTVFIRNVVKFPKTA